MFGGKVLIGSQMISSLTWSPLATKWHAVLKSHLCHPGLSRFPRQLEQPTLKPTRLNNQRLLCSNPWEASQPYVTTIDDGDSIIKRNNIVEPIAAEESPDLPISQGEENVVDLRNQSSFLQQPFKWLMWLLGPSLLLLTGMVPTLWLPLSSVFLGPNIAGLLSLVGLDCLFNIGATLFLLMADSCGRPAGTSSSCTHRSQVPLTYRLWNMGANLFGFLAPLILLFSSDRGYLQPQLPLVSSAVLLGPYLLLVAVQILTEMLTWHWNSPVWLVVPVIYEVYRVLQLMRGLRLAGEVGAPAWMVESIRGLVSWWVLILGVQLMRVAWFAGTAAQQQSEI